MRPNTVCFMMSSLDGRIDCEMTEKIEGSKEYYEILNSYHFDACVSGKITAKMHYAASDKYLVKEKTPVGKECVYMEEIANYYSVIMDTLGTLEWKENKIDGSPIIIALSEKVPAEYLDYLKKLGISYIVSGKEKINLSRVSEILNETFGVKQLGVVGGGLINGAYLEDGLIDEIAMLVGPGIDGRGGMRASFDGLSMEKEPSRLLLKDVKKYEDGAVLITYTLPRK